MDFIATAANVRAINYSIGMSDWLEAKQIARTIIRRWSADLCASRRLSYIQPTRVVAKVQTPNKEEEFDQIWRDCDIPLDWTVDGFMTRSRGPEV
jgi:hypothetical protein